MKTRTTHLLGLTLAGLVALQGYGQIVDDPTLPPSVSPIPPAEAEPRTIETDQPAVPPRPIAALNPRQALASEIMRAARSRLGNEPLTVDTVEAATLLILEALELEPDNLDSWHTALQLAMFADDESLKARALERLGALDPHDEVVRLMRLNAGLDRLQTYEERMAAYERLLTDANVQRIGPAVASRLAFDVALLNQRQGSLEQFSQWLTKALAWDSSNRSAAALATGFFAVNVNDPIGQAELLINLMLADPTDTGTQVELAERLLEHGAYVGAERMYRLAVTGSTANGVALPQTLLMDYVTAMWARGMGGAGGSVEQALNMLAWRQQALDMEHRYYVAREMPEVSAEQLRELKGPPDTEIALMNAVIRVSQRDAKASEAVDGAIAAHQAMIDIAYALRDLPEHERRDYVFNAVGVAQQYLDMAWTALWLGYRSDEAAGWLTAAADLHEIPPSTRARLEGWMALREGAPERAIEILTPMAANDLDARLGIAHAIESQGRTRDAAREFLAIHRAQPGAALGIWALAQARRILNQPIPPSDTAAALERLVASIPQPFDRAVSDSSYALELRITPDKITLDPYEPIFITVELTNRSYMPLAIDRNGPIRPHVLVQGSVRGIGSGASADVRAFIVDLGQRLRLTPRQRVSVRINLREYWPAAAINAHAMHGSIVKLRGIVNFRLSPNGRGEPGLYGADVDVPLMRVDGVRMSDDWAMQTAEAIRSGAQVPLQHLAILGIALAPRPRQALSAEDRAKLNDARQALTEAFTRLDPFSQAWLLTAWPSGQGLMVEGLQQIYAAARRSEHRLVNLAFLLFQASGPEDPIIDALKRSEDLVLRRLALAMEADAAYEAKLREGQ